MMLIKHSVGSYWLHNTQSRVLQADRFILEINKKGNIEHLHGLLVKPKPIISVFSGGLLVDELQRSIPDIPNHTVFRQYILSHCNHFHSTKLLVQLFHLHTVQRFIQARSEV